MKNRKNYLKSRKKQLKWWRIGYAFKDLTCPLCGQKSLVLIYEYDALGCTSCYDWRDKACGDPDCPYCSRRPKTTYEVFCRTECAVEQKQWRRDNYQHKINGAKRQEAKKAKYQYYHKRQGLI